jgi:lysylphosphatidylglycerol synthetase-like protein (DUF2156 family)
MAAWFVALIVLLLTGLVGCDEGFYVDSVAAFSATSQTNLVRSPQVLNEIRTSNVYNAETLNNIRITYVGTFSNSGPHSLGSFARGSTNNIAIQLSRKIGDLRKVVLENSNTDGWLMTTLYCAIRTAGAIGLAGSDGPHQ